MTDLYAVLGVSKTATPDEIKQAYRRLASQHHPDKGGDKEQFQQIQQAYAVLGDQDQRRAYDNPVPPFPGFGPGNPHNLHDIFSHMFGQQQRRSHVRISLWISLQESVLGGSQTVNIGTSGGTSTVKIEIPRGIDDGDNVQYSGIAPNGLDLVVQFRIKPDPQWQRQNLDLVTQRLVTVWLLILGGEIEVSMPTGSKVTVKIPPYTQPDTVMRLRGHGVSNGQTGDCLVKLKAEIPRNIPPEIVAAIQQHQN